MFSLLSLLDDVATTLDDVAAMSKVAIKNTGALMSDDLAVNAGVIDGVNPDRELPMVKAIFLGSLLNKVYCILGVFVLMTVYPPMINWIMLLGGLYLSFEGVHKIVEKVFHSSEEIKEKSKKFTEKEKISGAIRTDLILSAEIIVIAKSTLSGVMPLQVVTLLIVGLAASILIYGLVAVIVKVDDFGLFLITKGFKKVGLILVQSMPYTMKGLGIIGTLAMLLVGGGIIVHIFHIPLYTFEYLQQFLIGIVVGFCCVGVLEIKRKIF